jgi:hypothetical protein
MMRNFALLQKFARTGAMMLVLAFVLAAILKSVSPRG